MSTIKPVITNVVSTSDLHQLIDIRKFTNFSWGIYDKEIYGGVCGYVKFPYMKGRVTVFSSGKMISIGSRSEEESKNKLNQAKFYLVKNNLVKDIILKVKTKNIVALLSTTKTDMGKLSKFKNIQYEPNNFSGAILRLKDATCLIFSSGKIVITGAKSQKNLIDTSKMIQKILYNFQN